MDKIKKDLLDPLDNLDNLGIFEKYLGLSFKTFAILCSFVIIIGVYIGIVLYGKNSLSVLFKLENYENFLETNIYNLKHENAKLQKEYFELKEISAE